MSETNYATQPPQRPTFLTVLCVLSFIGGALGIYNGISTMTMGPEALENIEAEMARVTAELGDQSAMVTSMMEGTLEITRKTLENAMPLGLSALILSALGLFGVWQMWNLKKQGFTIYTLATIIGLIAPLFFLGFSTMAIMSLGFGALFSVVFIILYALNLKHMH